MPALKLASKSSSGNHMALANAPPNMVPGREIPVDPSGAKVLQHCCHQETKGDRQERHRLQVAANPSASVQGLAQGTSGLRRR
mmetsp:Transcript_90777/g.228295  ORF Transcript_90777/g.228295 Transcript_90777/m.228295 type:complete len:83 (-) Transcript_90777:69-317(-)